MNFKLLVNTNKKYKMEGTKYMEEPKQGQQESEGGIDSDEQEEIKEAKESEFVLNFQIDKLQPLDNGVVVICNPGCV